MSMKSPAVENFVDHFVAVALGHIDREYPSKLDHVINEACDLLSPRELHPCFFGSFDWHSSVHAHWLLVRSARLVPGLAQGAAVREMMDRHLTPENVRVEADYLRRPRSETYERTYGWAWLLKLAAELRLLATEGKGSEWGEPAARWSERLEPLTAGFVQRYLKYLPKATYPIRVGTHTNSAFGLALAWDYATLAKHAALMELIKSKVQKWYMQDVNCPAWEPDGTDFLSPSLMEVECVRRVMGPEVFLPWLDGFFPKLAEKQPATLFTPATVTDRTDGQIAHLDGLNLSRAWCWRLLAQALPKGDARRALAERAFEEHVHDALPHVTGDYMGEHWLATFALLAMSE
jgi:hypothetical protein